MVRELAVRSALVIRVPWVLSTRLTAAAVPTAALPDPAPAAAAVTIRLRRLFMVWARVVVSPERSPE